jgi:hypothetical protein
MGPERRKQLLLGGLVIVLLVGVSGWWSQSVSPPSASQGTSAAAAAARRSTSPAADAEAPAVHLKALATERPPLGAAQRNLFRFKPPPPPPAPPPSARPITPPTPPPPVPTGPPPPLPPPPIPIKFLGVVDVAGKSQRLAVLSDGRGGAPFSGKEGDIIEGRYRILRIGTESIEMAYLDGRGRQVIRQSGS